MAASTTCTSLCRRTERSPSSCGWQAHQSLCSLVVQRALATVCRSQTGAAAAAWAPVLLPSTPSSACHHASRAPSTHSSSFTGTSLARAVLPATTSRLQARARARHAATGPSSMPNRARASRAQSTRFNPTWRAQPASPVRLGTTSQLRGRRCACRARAAPSWTAIRARASSAQSTRSNHLRPGKRVNDASRGTTSRLLDRRRACRARRASTSRRTESHAGGAASGRTRSTARMRAPSAQGATIVLAPIRPQRTAGRVVQFVASVVGSTARQRRWN